MATPLSTDATKNENKMDQDITTRIKSVTQTIVTVTALVTATTGLLKACDKSVEKTGYEALAESITVLQKNQEILHDEIAELRRTNSYEEKLKSEPEDGESPKAWTDVPTLRANPFSGPQALYSSPSASTAPSASAAPKAHVTIKPPPTWSEVVQKADSQR